MRCESIHAWFVKKKNIIISNTACGSIWLNWKTPENFMISTTFVFEVVLRMYTRTIQEKIVLSSNTGHPWKNNSRSVQYLFRMYLRSSTIKSAIKDELFLSRAIGSQHILGVLHWVHQDTHLQRMTNLNEGYRQTIQNFFTMSIFISQKYSLWWIFLCLKKN